MTTVLPTSNLETPSMISRNASPLPPIMPVSHFGHRTVSIDKLHDTETGISELAKLQVCLECQAHLSHTFDHCLSKNETAILESARVIEEETLGEIRTEQPYFSIIKDPISHNPGIVTIDGIERDRWVRNQSKKPVISFPTTNSRERVGFAKRSDGKIDDKSFTSGFSGAIYKRMLDAKDREIAGLRTQLYNVIQEKTANQKDVSRLRVALNRSVNFYTFAEEWQASESSRLQGAVKFLKHQVSILIAHLINAEEQKRLVSL